MTTSKLITGDEPNCSHWIDQPFLNCRPVQFDQPRSDISREVMRRAVVVSTQRRLFHCRRSCCRIVSKRCAAELKIRCPSGALYQTGANEIPSHQSTAMSVPSATPMRNGPSLLERSWGRLLPVGLWGLEPEAHRQLSRPALVPLRLPLFLNGPHVRVESIADCPQGPARVAA